MTDPVPPTEPDGAPTDCPKCRSRNLRLLSSPDGEPYVLCRDCGFEFHPGEAGGRETQPRGVPPLKVVLASVIFANPLMPEAPRIAETMFRQFAPDDIGCFIEEITTALVDTQREIRAIYDLPHSEDDVRAFLDQLAVLLGAKLDGA